MPRLSSFMEQELELREQARRQHEQTLLRRNERAVVRTRSSSKTERDRIRHEWALMEIARRERRVASAAERRELRGKVSLVGGSSEELDRAFGPLNRYGKL